jgi:hypothetical protein
MAAALVVVVAAASWLGWREAQWRQAYYADTTGQLIYQVEMAHRQLVRAQETRVYQEKLDALATAHGYLVSAQVQANPLLERIAPPRKGRPAYMPFFYVPMLLQYAWDLTPDLPDQALQRRTELVSGLEQALKASLTDRTVKPGSAHVVDTARLKQSLDDFFVALSPSSEMRSHLRFEDDADRPTVTARQKGSEVLIRFEWTRTLQTFPYSLRGYLLLIRPGTGVAVSSDAGQLERMGQGASEPFTVMEADGNLHELVKGSLPEGWSTGTYMAVRIPEGLPQSLTLQLPGSSRPDLLLLRQSSGEAATPIPVE